MPATNTLTSRIRLKADIEANWIAHPIIPLAGELIIYSADATHSYTRLKVGDGTTNVNALPFIDSGTINGEEVEIAKYESFSAFPARGSADKLYIDLSNNRIYHYTGTNGYTQLSNFEFNISKTSAAKITSWSPGLMTNATVGNNTLTIINGLLPELLYYDTQVVSNITKE